MSFSISNVLNRFEIDLLVSRCDLARASWRDMWDSSPIGTGIALSLGVLYYKLNNISGDSNLVLSSPFDIITNIM